jgi:hypothetical protein
MEKIAEEPIPGFVRHAVAVLVKGIGAVEIGE